MSTKVLLRSGIGTRVSWMKLLHLPDVVPNLITGLLKELWLRTWTTFESFSAAPATVIVPATAKMLPSWLHWQHTEVIPVSTRTGSEKRTDEGHVIGIWQVRRTPGVCCTIKHFGKEKIYGVNIFPYLITIILPLFKEKWFSWPPVWFLLQMT